jgi:hypothetical protein
MGYDAACSLEIDGRTLRGTAHLEHKEIVFRGDTRLVIPLQEVRGVQARDGALTVRFADRMAVLRIGDSAEKWAARIANPPSRLEKLGVKAGMRVAVIDVDDALLGRELESRDVSVARGTRTRDLDMVFCGVRSRDDLARLESLKDRIKPSGAIWVVRVKGPSATVTESDSMAAGKRAGLVDVKVVSFSETHTAEKYVIPVEKRAPVVRSASPSPRTRGSATSRGRR